MKVSRDDDNDVRNRLLVAAAQMFAQSGFKATSVRKICERASANLAMVNYYFGSKNELYLAIIKRAGETTFLEHLSPLSETGVPPAQRLLAMIENLLFSLLSEGPDSDVAKLIAWELVEPTPALNFIVDTLARPMNDRLIALVHELSPCALTHEQARRHAFSIIGQIVLYSHSRPMNELLAPEIKYDEEGLRVLSKHIAVFSLRGLGVPA